MDGQADMPARMRKFLAKPPKRIAPETVAARRNKLIRRSQPSSWLDECCELQGWKCHYCRRHMRRKLGSRSTATLEHLHPISRGGRNQRSNVVAACQACNQAKGQMTVEEYAASLTPTQPNEE